MHVPSVGPQALNVSLAELRAALDTPAADRAQDRQHRTQAAHQATGDVLAQLEELLAGSAAQVRETAVALQAALVGGEDTRPARALARAATEEDRANLALAARVRTEIDALRQRAIAAAASGILAVITARRAEILAELEPPLLPGRCAPPAIAA